MRSSDCSSDVCSSDLSITVPPRSIPGGIFSPEHREIGLKKTIMIAIDRAHQPRPASSDHQIAFAGSLKHIAFGIDDLRLDTEKRLCGATGLQVRCYGWRCDNGRSGRSEGRSLNSSHKY